LAEVLYFDGSGGKRKIRLPYVRMMPKRIK
jgi:hypothetical protein